MAAPYFRAAVLVDATNSPSATRLNRIPDRPPDHQNQSFPKSARILRSSDFRTVYDTGKRYSCAHFAAFYLPLVGSEGSRVGFTTPRALGRAVLRNRVKRRFREAVRLHLGELISPWSVVLNPRRSSLVIPFPALEQEIAKLFRHLSKISQPGSLPVSSAYIK
jgi:ribonuclease P protein component